MSSVSKKQAIEKERHAVFSKDIVTKNPIFAVQEIKKFFQLFNLYADNRREANISDLAATAKTLGFEKKHPVIYNALSQIAAENQGNYVRFQQFLTFLTNKLGNPKTEQGRMAMFQLADVDEKRKLTIGDLLRLSDGLGFSFTFEEVQNIVKNVAGQKQKELTWEQFNDYIAKKAEKKQTF